MMTPISATDDQINMFYSKHMKPFLTINFFGKKISVGRILKSSCLFSYDGEDRIGFFQVSTITGKNIRCQLRNNIPMFVELTGFGCIRYDISYPKQRENCVEFYNMIKELAAATEIRFWKGGQI